MPVRYKVRVKDETGTLTAEFDDWIALDVFHKEDEVGPGTFTINGDDSRATYLTLDSRIEAWRNIVGPPAYWYREWAGFVVDTDPDQIDESGQRTVTKKLFDYNDLVNRRQVWYNTGDASYSALYDTGNSKYLAGETAIKTLVNWNAGPLATSPPRLGKSGVTQGLVVEEDQYRGRLWTGEDKGLTNLLESIKDIAKKTGLAFRVEPSGEAGFEFKVYSGQIGKDRSTNGLNMATGKNSAGYSPVVFSVDHDNMLYPAYSMLRSTEVNTILVIGQGVDDEQEAVLRENAVRAGDSLWNQREGTLRGGSQSVTVSLESEGDVELLARQRQERFTFQVQQTETSKYGEHYNFGDKVTVRYINGIERDVRIVAVHISLMPQGEKIELTLGELLI